MHHFSLNDGCWSLPLMGERHLMPAAAKDRNSTAKKASTSCLTWRCTWRVHLKEVVSPFHHLHGGLKETALWGAKPHRPVWAKGCSAKMQRGEKLFCSLVFRTGFFCSEYGIPQSFRVVPSEGLRHQLSLHMGRELGQSHHRGFGGGTPWCRNIWAILLSLYPVLEWETRARQSKMC